MMDVPNFRSYAFIRWRIGKTATETFEDLSTTFPDLSPGRSTVFGWVEAMKRGFSPLRREHRQDGLGRQGLQKTSPVCGN